MAKPKDAKKSFGKNLVSPEWALASKLKDNKAGFERMKSKLDPPKMDMSPTTEEVALQNRQREQSAALDKEENLRRKRLFSAMSGVRMFRANASSQGRSSGGGSSSVAAAPAAADMGAIEVFGQY